MTVATPIAPVDAAAIRARKRPIAVAMVFVAELAWAFVMASPAHAWASRVWGSHPAGDGVLWDPGGRHLLVWLGQNDAGLGVTVRTTLLLLFVGAVLMQIPLGALLVSLAFSRARSAPLDEDELPGAPAAGVPPPATSLGWMTAVRVGLGAFLPLAGLLVLGSLIGVILIAIGSLASSAVDHGLAASMGDARSFVFRMVTLALFVGLAALFGVVIDLARAAVAREAGVAAANGSSPAGWSMMLRGVRVALVTARRGLRRAAGAWAWRAALGFGLIAVGYAASHFLGGRGGFALTALFVVHQAVVLGRVALRASWLARATAMIAPVQDARDEKKS
jgi:hypothetical protein